MGSVRQMTDEDGVVTLTRQYEPYGEELSSTGSGVSSYGYTSEWVDSTTNLIYLRSRFYNPSIGIFASKDAWEGNYFRPLSLNKWTYGYSNPVGYTDHTGLSPQDCITNDNNSRNLTGWLVNEMTAQSNRWPSKPGIGTVVGFSNGLLSSAAFQIAKAALDKLAYGQDITEEGKNWIKRELAAGGGLRMIGYIWWAEMVKDGARWDFKDQIRVNPPGGPGESIMLCESATDCDWYEFSMPGNIFYAYVGRSVGFTEFEIRAGAVYAQQVDPENDPATNDWKPSWSPIGLDQATDEAAIDLGFQMYDLTNGSSNYQTVLNAFRTALKQNKSRLAHRSEPTIPYYTSFPIGLDGPTFPLRYFDGINGIGHFGGD